jgi:hypothetical protein
MNSGPLSRFRTISDYRTETRPSSPKLAYRIESPPCIHGGLFVSAVRLAEPLHAIKKKLAKKFKALRKWGGIASWPFLGGGIGGLEA